MWKLASLIVHSANLIYCIVFLVPTFFIVRLNLVHSGLGAGKLEVYLTEKMPGERPHIELDANKDRRWFTFYVKQFEELWKSATPCPLDDPLSI